MPADPPPTPTRPRVPLTAGRSPDAQAAVKRVVAGADPSDTVIDIAAFNSSI